MPQIKQSKQGKTRKTCKTRKTRGGADAPAPPVYGYFCDGPENVTQCIDIQGQCIGGSIQRGKKHQQGGFNIPGTYCDGNPTQCSDAFSCDQVGGDADDYTMYKYYKKLYKSMKQLRQ